jgi:hypothetical protein
VNTTAPRIAAAAVLALLALSGCQVGIHEPWVLSDQELREERTRPEGLEHRLRHRAARYYSDR